MFKSVVELMSYKITVESWRIVADVVGLVHGRLTS